MLRSHSKWLKGGVGVMLVVMVVAALVSAPAIGRAQTVPTRTPTPRPETATPTPVEPPPTETPAPTATDVPPTNTPLPAATSTPGATGTQAPTATPTLTATRPAQTPQAPTVVPAETQSAITLTLVANTTMVVPGQVVTLTVAITNTETAALADVEVVLVIPPELRVISSQVEDGQGTAGATWQIPVLAPDRTAAWVLVAEVNARVPAGTVLDVRAQALDAQAVVSLGLPPAFLPRVGGAGSGVRDWGLGVGL